MENDDHQKTLRDEFQKVLDCMENEIESLRHKPDLTDHLHAQFRRALLEKALGKFIEDMDIMNFRVQLDLSTQECDCAPRRRMRQIGQLDTSTVSCNLTMQEIDEALAVTEAAAREEETSKIEQPQVKEEEKSCQTYRTVKWIDERTLDLSGVTYQWKLHHPPLEESASQNQ
ncbi:hypothetical protein JZ751_028965 [Albula glossodonta]|uniref:Uncharacterized protein n=1 Tax=Albula glossodonta TaxID=121402 RepID=A0A8T2MQH8_9TELE|nr:hypothetical protein JZ751_028965 [Albula glossodonta]